MEVSIGKPQLRMVFLLPIFSTSWMKCPTWICLFDAWKKFPKYSPKWDFNGDESYGRIHKSP